MNSFTWVPAEINFGFEHILSERGECGCEWREVGEKVNLFECSKNAVRGWLLSGLIWAPSRQSNWVWKAFRDSDLCEFRAGGFLSAQWENQGQDSVLLHFLFCLLEMHIVYIKSWIFDRGWVKLPPFDEADTLMVGFDCFCSLIFLENVPDGKSVSSI